MVAGAEGGEGPDFRAPVTRRQLDEYFADPAFEIWDLTIWRNERLKGRNDYFAPDGAIFGRLTHAQQLLVLVGQLDGDIRNGGIGQLFFNQASEVPAMLEALEEMKCAFAADVIDGELRRLAEMDFIPKWIEAHKRFDEGAGGTKEEWQRSWEAFMAFVGEMFPGETVSDDYYARGDETLECVRTYIKGHVEEFFEVIGP